MLNWNARSLAAKQAELIEFLNFNQIDVAVLTETHLKPTVNFRLPDHTVYRMDRTGAQGGGVAIAVRKGLAFRALPDYRLKIIEAIGVELVTPQGPIEIIAAYCPTQCKNLDGSTNRLKSELQILTRRQGKFILAGDLNARHSLWGNSRDNRNGKVLADDLQTGHYAVLHPDSPTYYSAAGVGSILDIAITNIVDNCSKPNVTTDLSSDHLPVVFEVNQEVCRHQQVRRRNYHRVNWPQLQRFVEHHIDQDPALETCADIDRVLQQLTDTIGEAETRFIPTVAVTSKFTSLDTLTKRIISLRNCIRRQFQRTRNPARKVLYKKLNKIIALRVEKRKNRQFRNDIKQLPNYSKPFWRLAKVLKTRPKPVPPLRDLDKLCVTAEEKANLISKQFLASHNLGRDIVSPVEATVAASINELPTLPCELPDDRRVSANELKNYIRFTRNMKAPGFDGIFNIVLKNLGPRTFTLLANVFNRCLEIGYFPSAWKLSKVVPILKPGKDPTSPAGYRPISLLSAISKLFERVIYSRLLEHTDANNILLDEQFGFRRGHSTVHQLQRVTNQVKRSKELSKTTVMALLDIEKAFDNVWHAGLTHKLMQQGCPTYLVRVITAYLHGRTSQVSVSGTLSDPYPIPAGVPQGSILGPILYNLYTSDIPPLPSDGKLSLFADDSAISYSGRVIRHLVNKLQAGLNTYVEYLNTWKIRVNAAKTQIIVFPHRNSDRLKPNTKVKVMECEVDWTNDVRYLGLIMDSKLLYRSHVNDLVTKSTIMLRKLYPIINRRSKLSVVNKLATYKQVVLPMLLYGSPVWMGCAQTHLKKLQVVQNRFLKMILNLPHNTRTTEVHRLANLDPIITRITNLATRHRTRARVSEWHTIRRIYS